VLLPWLRSAALSIVGPTTSGGAAPCAHRAPSVTWTEQSSSTREDESTADSPGMAAGRERCTRCSCLLGWPWAVGCPPELAREQSVRGGALIWRVLGYSPSGRPRRWRKQAASAAMWTRASGGLARSSPPWFVPARKAQADSQQKRLVDKVGRGSAPPPRAKAAFHCGQYFSFCSYQNAEACAKSPTCYTVLLLLATWEAECSWGQHK
jgi:hypothetical protein